MPSTEQIGLSRTERELRAERLGTALRGLAAELVDERRKVAELRRDIRQLKARLESRQAGHEDELIRGSGARPRV